MNTKQTNDLHQHLLDMLGAKDHQDAGRIIGELHAAKAHPSRGVVDDWTAADNGDYDRSIHANPSAEAWADFFVATFPKQAHLRDLMRGWFANAMMAMHDHLHYKAQATAQPAVPTFDMLAHLQRQREWSGRTFGPGPRTAGVIDHIRKELREIEADPTDLSEWIDVVILALDGAWRAGGTPEQIIATLVAKQTKNEGRTWPDWRTADPDKAIEHDRAQDAQPAVPSVPEGMVLVPAHYAENVGYAAVMLENSASPVDRLNAPPLRTLVKLLAATAKDQPAQGEG